MFGCLLVACCFDLCLGYLFSCVLFVIVYFAGSLLFLLRFVRFVEWLDCGGSCV